MKFTTVALVATVTAVAVAQPHVHLHRHAHLHARPNKVKRQVTVTTSVTGATAFAYVLDGKPISVDEVCNGLSSNLLKFADGSGPAGICNQASSSSSVAVTTSIPSASAGQFYGKNGTSTSAPSGTSATAAPSASGWSSGWSGSGLSGGKGVTAAFPDGTLDCSTFPSDYGAVPLSYLGLGGWSGLQSVTIAGLAVTNIVTGISGQVCTDGMMCSYACPPGYQKSQWPSTQGSTGQSVGGIQCKNGKLYLTNPGLSKNLCIPGAGGVKAQNNAGAVVSICRTDYPGTESETIPVELQAGQTSELACPEASTYFKWQSKSTSAQYYLNPIGVPASQACQWGQAGSDMGNFAPMNFGVGASDGKTWLSLFPNAPTTTAKFSGTVEIQGNLSGSCKWNGSQYCNADGCNDTGCTVSVISGEATYVISHA